MRFLTPALISLCFILILTAPGAALTADDVPLLTYTSAFYEIGYPSGFSIVSAKTDYGMTYFNPPPKDKRLKDLKYRLLVIKFPSNDLRDYSLAVGNEFKDMNVEGTFEFTTMDSQPATKFIYVSKDKNQPSDKTVRIYTIKDNRVFDLRFTLPAQDDDALRPLVDRLIASFHIKENPS